MSDEDWHRTRASLNPEDPRSPLRNVPGMRLSGVEPCTRQAVDLGELLGRQGRPEVCVAIPHDRQHRLAQNRAVRAIAGLAAASLSEADEDHSQRHPLQRLMDVMRNIIAISMAYRSVSYTKPAPMSRTLPRSPTADCSVDANFSARARKFLGSPGIAPQLATSNALSFDGVHSVMAEGFAGNAPLTTINDAVFNSSIDYYRRCMTG